MTDKFYITRTLYDGEQIYTESELLASFEYIIVLAEPGAGKTELLGSMAKQLQTRRQSATGFRYLNPDNSNALVLDAFDEVSRVSPQGIFEIFAKAQATGAGKIVISSRSSEWDGTYTHNFEDFFGKNPKIVRLTAFNAEEQKQLFKNHVPNEDFTQFRNEVGRFELEPLLSNPVFLKLFADAYVESNRRFVDKSSIFEKAIEHLAKEVNPEVSQKGSEPFEKKIEFANEVFAKLLLSGSEGIALTDIASDRLYPRLASLVDSNLPIDCVLSTKLFKPGDREEQHLPVHKIVAEYSAARYLTQRIIHSSDSLSLPQCLAVIAPNATVRDELRGMLGWMAALGNDSIQEAIIKLDPYAVLANGDPSQLLPSSKLLLIQKLIDVAKENPSFRRGDFWRTFSTSGFFTPDVVNQLKPLLVGEDEHGDLRGLLLELLVGSAAIPHLVDELQQLMFDSENGYYIRSLASDCLLGIKERDYRADVEQLIADGGETSLKLAAHILETVGVEEFERALLLSFLRTCEYLYPRRMQSARNFRERYFIKKLISTLELPLVEWLLNELTLDLSCVCGKPVYSCECRNGVSKIAGSLLDHYFDLSEEPYDTAIIWQWLRNLHFHRQMGIKSRSVQELQQNDGLRQSIIQLAFGHETDSRVIADLQVDLFGSMGGHSGLCILEQDHRFIADIAFDTENVNLWSRFLAIHHFPQNKEDQGTNILRRHMHEQARLKPEFMKEWVRRNRIIATYRYEDRKRELRYSREWKRREREQANIHIENIKYVTENRELVESGKHWGCLDRFAWLTLDQPKEIETEFGDVSLVRNALMNCFDFIAPKVPNLRRLAELKCESKHIEVEIVLIAACLETWRAKGSLEGVSTQVLTALRTKTNFHYSALESEEQDALMDEVDRLLFPKIEDAEQFLREYVEPQLSSQECEHADVSWLKYQNVFKPLQKTLPVEWLHRFPHIETHTLHELFEMAVQFGDRAKLEGIIRQRCTDLMSNYTEHCDNKLKQVCIFWLVRAFYFLLEMPIALQWELLTQDKNTILTFSEYSGQMNRSEYKYWPVLSAEKVEALLLAFFDSWPQVDLPSTWGDHSPRGEQAYRFLSDVIWRIGDDSPDNALPILDRLIADNRFSDFESKLRSIRASVIRDKALSDFEAPSPQKIVALLDNNEVATVEGLRALLMQELQDYQADLNGSETTTKDIFYEKGERLGEVPATLRIADRMRLRLEGKGITVTPEHQLKDANRSDFTCSKTIGVQRRLLVAEVKGQWHKDLYNAASEQLYDRYSIHPNAEQQGIYLVLWFGHDEKVANRKNNKIKTAGELKKGIEDSMSTDLRGKVDVFVLDLSRSAQ